MINQEKMEASSKSLDLETIDVKKSIKIFGVHFTYNTKVTFSQVELWINREIFDRDVSRLGLKRPHNKQNTNHEIFCAAEDFIKA